MKLEERLEKMVNKSFMYNATAMKVLSFKVFSEEVTIITDKGWKTFPITKINAEIEKFLPIEPETLMPVVHTTFNNQDNESLKNLLMDNIKKIKENPEYLKQAKGINDQAKTVLAIARIELEAIKLKKEMGLL